MEFKIDDDIPFPSARARYPFGEMSIGQSVFIAGTMRGSIYNSMAFHKPKKFVGRTVTENGVKGVRVWRVA